MKVSMICRNLSSATCDCITSKLHKLSQSRKSKFGKLANEVLKYTESRQKVVGEENAKIVKASAGLDEMYMDIMETLHLRKKKIHCHLFQDCKA